MASRLSVHTASRYELFSLLMHSGSAISGHYFAYVKELRSGSWYKFNDSHVSAATPEQLEAKWFEPERLQAQ